MIFRVVEAAGFEPTTSRFQSESFARLSYTSINGRMGIDVPGAGNHTANRPHPAGSDQRIHLDAVVIVAEGRGVEPLRLAPDRFRDGGRRLSAGLSNLRRRMSGLHAYAARTAAYPEQGCPLFLWQSSWRPRQDSHLRLMDCSHLPRCSATGSYGVGGRIGLEPIRAAFTVQCSAN